LIEVRIASENGKKQPPFDPTVKGHPTYWPGDISTRGSSCVFISRDRAKGGEMKLYANLFFEAGYQKRTEVTGFAIFDGKSLGIPPAILAPERPWTLIGTFTMGDDRIPKFAEATAEERDAEWRKLTGKEPPKPTPAIVPPPQPPATPSASTVGKAEMDRRRSFGMAMASAKTDEEKKQIFEKALREAANDEERERLKKMMSAFTGAPQTPAPGPKRK